MWQRNVTVQFVSAGSKCADTGHRDREKEGQSSPRSGKEGKSPPSTLGASDILGDKLTVKWQTVLQKYFRAQNSKASLSQSQNRFPRECCSPLWTSSPEDRPQEPTPGLARCMTDGNGEYPRQSEPQKEEREKAETLSNQSSCQVA